MDSKYIIPDVPGGLEIGVSQYLRAVKIALLGHTHDILYSLVGHDHDDVYSILSHDHDTDYSALGHDHDTDYLLLDGTNTMEGNLEFSGTGKHITGDFTNATIADRLSFQTSTANSATAVGAIPNGTSTSAYFMALNASTPANCGYFYFGLTSTYSIILSGKDGTGTYLPVVFSLGGAERMRIGTSGGLGLNYSTVSTIYSIIIKNYGDTSSYYSLYAMNSSGSLRHALLGDGSIYAFAGYGSAATPATNVNYYAVGLGSTSNYGIYLINYGATSVNCYTTNEGGGYLRDTAWSYGPSEVRFKENIVDIEESSLAKVLATRPVRFDYIDGHATNRVGFLVEDLVSTHPDLVTEVSTSPNQKPTDPKQYGIRTTDLIPYMIKSTQHQQGMIDSLVARIEDLEVENITIHAKLAEIEAQLIKLGQKEPITEGTKNGTTD